MTRLRKRLAAQWTFYLAFTLVYGAILLRTLVVYRGHAQLVTAVFLLAAAFLLSVTQPAVTGKWRGYFPLYLLVQTALVITLLRLPIFPDYFAVLFAVLSVQIVQEYSLRTSFLLIALFTPITMVLLVPSLGTNQAIAMGLFYTGVNALMVSFAVTMQRAQKARAQNQALMAELAQSNQQLQNFAAQLEGLAVARERSNLARELHDSVTQTLFSMTLTTKSALMLVDRDFSRVGGQIVRLNQLAQSAQAEMRLLIAELGPEKAIPEDLQTILQRRLQFSNFSETLKVELETCGSGLLTVEESRNLFRIVQEALNNAIKHAQASRAIVRLHLEAPYWVEIEDNGVGFDPQQTFGDGHLGLRGMRERAAAIDWVLTIQSAPGTHTRIHIEKSGNKGEKVHDGSHAENTHSNR